jgi:hypothetical protein
MLSDRASCRGFWAAHIGAAIADGQGLQRHTKGGDEVKCLWANLRRPLRIVHFRLDLAFDNKGARTPSNCGIKP